jgi:zinc protease
MLKKIFFFTFFFLGISYTYATPRIESWQLSNQARVLFVEERQLPIIDIKIEFDAGVRRNPPNKAGLAELTNSLIDAGTKKTTDYPAFTQAKISDSFADIAAKRDFYTDPDRAGVALRTLTQHKEKAISLLAHLLSAPSFPNDVFIRERTHLITHLKEEQTKPAFIANQAFWKTIYQNHPYGYQATPTSIKQINLTDIRTFYETHYTASHAIVSIVGDITKEEANAIAHTLTNKLPRTHFTLPPIPEPRLTKTNTINIPHPTTQTHLIIGLPTTTRQNPHYFALLVGNYTLGGGGFSSRLLNEIRVKNGLAYSAQSYFYPLIQKGPFQISLQTKKEETTKALTLTKQTLNTFLSHGPTAQEIQAAKDNLTNGFALRIDNNRKILDNIANIGYYQLPLTFLDTWTEQIRKVTAKDIQTAFQKTISENHITTIIVGP